MSGCGAPDQSAARDVGANEVVLTGKVIAEGNPIGGAYVRLLDSTGEFTAEVVSSPEGDFRFYAAPGKWTVRALHRSTTGQAEVLALGPGVHLAEVALA